MDSFEIIIKYSRAGWYWLLEKGKHKSVWSGKYFKHFDELLNSLKEDTAKIQQLIPL